MSTRRGTIFAGIVLLLTLAVIVVEDVLFFLATTGTPVASSPTVLVAVPLALFLVVAGLLFGWAILTSETLR